MAVDYRLLEELKRKSEAQSVVADNRSGIGGGGRGEPPGFGQRLSAVEASIISIDKTLAVIIEQLRHIATREDLALLRTEIATIAGKLDTKASAIDLAELKGRVGRIPTVPVLVSVLLLISLLFAAASWTVRHLPENWSRALQ